MRTPISGAIQGNEGRVPVIEAPPDLSSRDYEFLFRSADTLWAVLGDHPVVYRCRRHFSRVVQGKDPAPCSTPEARRFGAGIRRVADVIAERWAQLYDEWQAAPDDYVFDDGFAALFLLRLLWANDVVLLRGHTDHTWKLTTSLDRARQRGDDSVRKARRAADIFLAEVAKLGAVRWAYSSGMPESHRDAILQHYGFPTDLIDLTYSYDIALYFAEGGTDFLSTLDDSSSCGAIYAIPTSGLPYGARIMTLPPAIMRPSLQRGVFLGGLSHEERESLERFKYVYRHRGDPVLSCIVNPMGIARYLFPASDPLAVAAKSAWRAACS